MGHYSERLKRSYYATDWLFRDEAAQVISENSGRTINPLYIYELVRDGVLHPYIIAPSIRQYQYCELANLVVKNRPGRRKQEQPTDNTLRQRKYKAKVKMVAEEHIAL